MLEGDDSQGGLQTQCPLCGVAFIIPVPAAQPAAPVYPQQFPHGPGTAPEHGAQSETAYPAEPEPAAEPESPAPPVRDLSSELEQSGVAQPPSDFSAEDFPPTVLHIPCPNGHELETSVEMIGEEVLCPHCKAQFVLREEHSVEYRQKQERLEQRRAQFWVNWAIAAAVIVVLMFLAMIVRMVRG